MSEPIRILHVFSRMQRGGAELRTLDILRHIDRRRYRLHFCVLSGLAGELDEEIRDLGGEVHLLRRGRIGFARRFRQLLTRQRFEVVCSHVLNYSGIVLRLADKCNVPVRVAVFRSPRDGQTGGPVRKVYRQLMRHWIDRHATHLVSVSQGVMDGVWGPRWKSDSRCEVIYNGLDLAPFEPATDATAVRREFGLPAGVPLFIHVGRMREPKNHLRLLSIFAQASKCQPSARLLLVGQGGNSTERQVRQRIAELGIADRVVIAGQRTDVPRLLKAADALIFPSLWEGLPGAVLEACAAGTPVLAADLPGIREIAARLPGVRCLSLGADDATWAEALREISRPPNGDVMRRQIQDAFADSVFVIDECARQHCRIWEEARPTAAKRGAL